MLLRSALFGEAAFGGTLGLAGHDHLLVPFPLVGTLRGGVAPAGQGGQLPLQLQVVVPAAFLQHAVRYCLLHGTARLALVGTVREPALAGQGLWKYLETDVPGLWRDRMNPDGSFIEEPAPASSFYHIVGAILDLDAALNQ